MFSELMDPTDINYYDDIERLFKLGAGGGTPRTPPSVTNPAASSAGNNHAAADKGNL
ncbi:hypothetical protein PI124_g6929 [Phytophthora idaei]|nr:hypothetical protein PI125_g20290 [Phytophthora idaei]KAG3128305.1 hypothetical protein PI126_g21465 [Phytophthora idaei]KAG3248397.1 hypothetical protein PI124_g6929 [Phytophthora idaei]